MDSSSSIGSYVSPFVHLQNLPVKLRVYRLCVLGGCNDDDDDDDAEFGTRVHKVRCLCGCVAVVEEVVVALLDVGQSHRNFRR